MELYSLKKPSTTSSAPPRLFQVLSRLLPHSSATTEPKVSSELKASPPSPPPLPPNLTTHALTPSTLPAFKRLTSLLFPIRYPDKFFTDALSDPTTSSLSRQALWRESARPGKRKRTDADDGDEIGTDDGKVVGGIRCRLEEVPLSGEETDAGAVGKKQVYVQTIGVLSPYRTLGIATALLEEVVEVAIREFGITAVYAHVWEANTEALEWYVRRGFSVEKALVEGYYRRLRPAGARVVRRLVGVGEYVRVGMKAASGVDGGDKVGKCGEEEGHIAGAEVPGILDEEEETSSDGTSGETFITST